MTIGERIQEARKNKGLTQKELADKIDCAEITIRQYETGKRQPRFEQIGKIAQALEISESSLISGNDDMLKMLSHLEYQKYELEKKLIDASEKEKDILTMQILEKKSHIQTLQNEIRDYLKDSDYIHKSSHRIVNGEVESIEESFELSDRAKFIKYYDDFNKVGKREALKRISEMAKLEEYTRPPRKN